MFAKRLAKSLWITIFLFVMVAGTAVAADSSNLAARAATWEKEYNAGNLDAIAALYSADGCRMPPNAKTLTGTADILAELKAGYDMGGTKIKIAVTSAESNGDWGSGYGTFELMKADGSVLDQGKWMNVSRKVGGVWKFQCDIYNSDMPLPAPPAKQ